MSGNLSFVIAASVTSLIWGEAAPPPKFEPHKVTEVMAAVRELQRAADAVVEGVPGSYEHRLEMSERIAERLRAAPSDVWRATSDVYALLNYVLVGGDPGVLRDILRRGAIGEAQRGIALGVLAFAEQRLEQAKVHLSGASLDPLPTGVANAVALVQAAVLAEERPGEAIEKLETLRLNSRSTQIEASALRQIAQVAIRNGQMAEGLDSIQKYLRRFPRSLFNDQYIAQFAAEIASAPGDAAATLIQRAGHDIAAQNPEIGAKLLLELAREAVFRGQLDLAVAAAKAVLAVPGVDAFTTSRATLYLLAAQAATGAGAKAREELVRLPRAGLSAAEIELLDAAIAISSQVKSRRLMATALAPVSADNKSRSDTGTTLSDRPSSLNAELVSRAKGVLKAADDAIVPRRTH